jgi:hypothetical protein
VANIINAQTFATAASGALDQTSLAEQFREAMDTVLLTCGRDVIVHLPPSKLPCVSSDCVFNSFYKKFVSQAGKVCETCRGEGFIIEPRHTTYIANIRWTNEPYYNPNGEERAVAGRIGADFVRTKMVKEAFNHIKQARGATVDSIQVELLEEPRLTGFAGSLFYCVAWWKVAGRS